MSLEICNRLIDIRKEFEEKEHAPSPYTAIVSYSDVCKIIDILIDYVELSQTNLPSGAVSALMIDAGVKSLQNFGAARVDYPGSLRNVVAGIYRAMARAR